MVGKSFVIKGSLDDVLKEIRKRIQLYLSENKFY